jgi:hypothetical protein
MANLLYILIPIAFASLVAGISGLARRRKVPKRLDLEVDAFSRAMTAIKPSGDPPPRPPSIKLKPKETRRRGNSPGQ